MIWTRHVAHVLVYASVPGPRPFSPIRYEYLSSQANWLHSNTMNARKREGERVSNVSFSFYGIFRRLTLLRACLTIYVQRFGWYAIPKIRK